MDFCQAWNGVKHFGLENKFWKTLIWSVWNIRNYVVFDHAKLGWDLERRLVKLRWGYRIKSLAWR